MKCSFLVEYDEQCSEDACVDNLFCNKHKKVCSYRQRESKNKKGVKKNYYKHCGAKRGDDKHFCDDHHENKCIHLTHPRDKELKKEVKEKINIRCQELKLKDSDMCKAHDKTNGCMGLKESGEKFGKKCGHARINKTKYCKVHQYFMKFEQKQLKKLKSCSRCNEWFVPAKKEDGNYYKTCIKCTSGAKSKKDKNKSKKEDNDESDEDG